MLQRKYLSINPSGDSSPSEEDKRITRRLKESGQLLGIPFLDNVIFGKDSYTSFADEEIL